MKYYIKEKLLFLHKRLYVYDETEKQVYEISLGFSDMLKKVSLTFIFP